MNLAFGHFTFFVLLIVLIVGQKDKKKKKENDKNECNKIIIVFVPPHPKYNGTHRRNAARCNGEYRDTNNNTYEWERGCLFDGDIMTMAGEYHPSMWSKLNTKLWPNGVVPYHIVKTLNPQITNVVYRAMNEFNKRSCIKFRRYRPEDTSWILISHYPGGYWSYVGRKEGGQVVNFGFPNVNYSTVIHLFLHVLGFYHTHNQPNRDKYVTLHKENMRKGKFSNFFKFSETDPPPLYIDNPPYDFGSVMHYSNYAFSKNGKPTITAKYQYPEASNLGNDGGFSRFDLRKLNYMYKCKKFTQPTDVRPFS